MLLWPLRSSSSPRARKNSDFGKDGDDDDDKMLRKESEGDNTACEDWSDDDDDEDVLNDDLILTPVEDEEDGSITSIRVESDNDNDNDTPRRMSRFRIFQRSSPKFKRSDEDLTVRNDDEDYEEPVLPPQQASSTLRHIVRAATEHHTTTTATKHENHDLEMIAMELNHREQAVVVHTKPSTTTNTIVGNPYQVTKEIASLSSTTTARGKLEVTLFCAYLCSCVALALPVLLLPLVSVEITSELGDTSVAAFAASVASVATLGAGVGKFFNGFVCKWLGGRQASFWYLLGMAACSLFLSKTSSHVGLAMAGIEFFSSIQFTCMSLLLNNHYEGNVTKLTCGMTTVSVASTSGMLVANFLGTALLQRHDWRTVSQFGALISMVGAIIIQFRVREFPSPASSSTNVAKAPGVVLPIKDNERLTLRGVVSSLRHVLGSRLFWQVGVAHAMAFLARTSDRVLGTFFQETTLLPRNISGGLLACLAIGYFHGLLSGKEITHAKTVAAKSRLLKRRYAWAVLSTLVLALVANKRVISLLQRQSNMWLILILALSSGAMTSFLSFQIYLLPSMVASTFGKNKPVCLSFFDGLGYFLASPIWATTSWIVSHPLVGPHGWSVNFAMLALFFAMSGILMMRALPPVLHKQMADSSTSKDPQRDSGSDVVHFA